MLQNNNYRKKDHNGFETQVHEARTQVKQRSDKENGRYELWEKGGLVRKTEWDVRCGKKIKTWGIWQMKWSEITNAQVWSGISVIRCCGRREAESRKITGIWNGEIGLQKLY